MKKLSQKITALILALSINLTACSSKKTNSSKPNPTFQKPNIILQIPNKDVNSNVTDSTQDLSFYSQFFQDYTVDYLYPKYLTTESDLQEFQTIIDSYQECDFFYDGDADDLYEQIKNNTRNYVNEFPKYINLLDIDYAYDLFIEGSCYNINIADTILEANYQFKTIIHDLLDKQFSQSTQEDIHRMLDLKIILDTEYMPNLDEEDPSFTLGCYNDQDNTICLYFHSLFANTIKDSDQNVYNHVFSKDENFEEIQKTIEQTLKHEFNHMRQQICPDRLAKGQLNDNISYNSDTVTALLESSAETAIYLEDYSYQNNDSFDYTYHEHRLFEAELLMITMTDNSNNLEDFYNSIFNADINSLLQYFKITTDADKKTFLNILNAYDGLDLRNFLPFKILQKDIDEGIAKIDCITHIGYNYKLDIMRLAFKNLVDYGINNNDLTLEEYIMLRNIIMYKMCDDSETPDLNENNGEKSFAYYFEPSFSSQFWELVNQFNAFLKNKFSVTDNELERFLEYSNNIYSYSAIKNYTASQSFINLVAKFPKLELILFNCYSINNYNYQRIKVKN